MRAFRHAVLVLLVAVFARADDQSRLRTEMIGGEETPAIYTAGSGVFTARILDNDTRIDFRMAYENLSGPPLFAHVHFGQRGVAGAVSFFLCGGSTKPLCPASNSGVVTGTVVAADVIGPAAQGIAPGNLAAIIAEIRAGLAYANMHTVKHPGGEIRGQIQAREGARGHDQDD